MRVLMLLEGEFPPDERVEKEALTLAGAGYEVEVFAFSFKKGPSVGIHKGIKVYRPYISRKIFSFYPAILVLPVYYWYRRRQFKKLVCRYDYDYIHVHDLPMSQMGYWLKRRCNAKLICDQHEFFSNWIGRTAHMNTLPGRMIGFMSNWVRYERKWLRKADLVITVSDNLRQLYVDLYSLEETRIISVPNTPMRKNIEVQSADLGLAEKYGDRFVLFYGGMIDILRGIDLVIKSLPLLRERIPNIMLVLAGRIRKGCDPIAIARSLGVEDLVKYVGFLNPEELRAYMESSSICFATSPADSIEVNNAISTKIFQYISARKPILVGNAKLMKEMVMKYNLGMSTDEKNPEMIAGTILRMKENLSSFTFDVPEEIMYWEYTSELLLNKYRDL